MICNWLRLWLWLRLRLRLWLWLWLRLLLRLLLLLLLTDRSNTYYTHSIYTKVFLRSLRFTQGKTCIWSASSLFRQLLYSVLGESRGVTFFRVFQLRAPYRGPMMLPCLPWLFCLNRLVFLILLNRLPPAGTPVGLGARGWEPSNLVEVPWFLKRFTTRILRIP